MAWEASLRVSLDQPPSEKVLGNTWKDKAEVKNARKAIERDSGMGFLEDSWSIKDRHFKRILYQTKFDGKLVVAPKLKNRGHLSGALL